MARILAFGENGNPESPPVVAEYKEAKMSHPQPRNRASAVKRDRWLRMQAVQVVTMLPDDPEEARMVLSYAKGILENFVETSETTLSVVKSG